jgi:hypothetical protein
MRIRETSDLGYTFIHGNKYMVVLVRKVGSYDIWK